MADRAARRHPASSFPEIRGIRLVPLRAGASLVNLSATGMLVETADRSRPGTPLTVWFEGDFRPPTIECRIVRCEVAGIAPDGSLRYHLGLAFSTRIALAQDAGDEVDAPAAVPAAPPLAAVAVAAAAVAAAGAPVIRNRW